MKRFFYLLIVVFSSVSSPAQVTMMNDVSPQYLDKLIAIGRAYYPRFKWTQAKVSASKANLDKTRSLVFDFISMSYVYYPGNTVAVYNGNGVSSFFSGYQVGVFLNVGSMLAKPATVRQAKQEYVAAQQDKEATDLDIDLEIRRRYYTYLQTLNILKIKSHAVSDAEDLQKTIKYKFEKGQVTLDVYNQSLVTFSTQSQEKVTAEANLLIAKASLEEMLGTSLESIK